MAETYKPIFPGNVVTHLNAHALPNDSFHINKRAIGSPQDRHVQSWMFCPGWLGVRKVGFVNVKTEQSVFDITLPSPDLRPDSKPRSDIIGLWVPEGAFVWRAGFRIEPMSSQPGSSSSGPVDEGSIISGISGTPGSKLVLSSALPAAVGPATITGTAISTASDAGAVVIDAEGNVPIGQQLVASAFGTPQRVTATGGLNLRLYAMDSGVAQPSPIQSMVLGGAFIACELVYAVPEAVTCLDDVHLGGVMYGGVTP